jgi:hypothetical protein
MADSIGEKIPWPHVLDNFIVSEDHRMYKNNFNY